MVTPSWADKQHGRTAVTGLCPDAGGWAGAAGSWRLVECGVRKDLLRKPTGREPNPWMSGDSRTAASRAQWVWKDMFRLEQGKLRGAGPDGGPCGVGGRG